MVEHDYLKIILESNLINFLVVVSLLLVFLPKVLKASLEGKKALLSKAALELEKQKLIYEEKLAKVEERISSIKSEADIIVLSAQQAADEIKKQIIDSAEQEIEKMKAIAYKEIEDHKKSAYQEVEAFLIREAVSRVENAFLEKIEKGEDTKYLATFAKLQNIH